MLEQELRNLPLTQEHMRSRASAVRDSFSAVDARASEVNVLIQSLEAEVVAIEQYFIHERAEQRVNPEMLQQQLDPVKEEIKQTRAVLDKVRGDIAGGRPGSHPGGSGGQLRSHRRQPPDGAPAPRAGDPHAGPPAGRPGRQQQLPGADGGAAAVGLASRRRCWSSTAASTASPTGGWATSRA